MLRCVSFSFKVFLIILLTDHSGYSQLNQSRIKELLVKYSSNWSKAQFEIQSSYYDSILNCQHYYIQELINGVGVYPELTDLHIDSKGKILSANIHSPQFPLLSKDRNSIVTEAKALEIYLYSKGEKGPYVKDNSRQSRNSNYNHYYLVPNTKNSIRIKFCYYSDGSRLLPSYRILYQDLSQEAEWDCYVNALNLEIINEVNIIQHCGSELSQFESRIRIQLDESSNTNFMNNSYRVYPIPIESPLHGSSVLINSPWLKAQNASPFGWHDDGQFKFQHTIGNNVDCYEDIDADNQPTGGNAARTFGGANLNFDFIYNYNLNPILNKDAALTNLFYWSNIMHDVLYQYGFNEAAGNFQYNNFSKGGLDLDDVAAEGLDNLNGARNNASFSCPPDGYKGRLQTFAWQLPVYDSILIETPNQIYGNLVVVHSAVSPSLFGPYRSEIILANDGSGFPYQGCNPYINASQVNGKIAMIDRGICSLNDKITQAQNAGAIGLLICNVDDNPPSVMGGFSSGVGLPVMNISKTDGDLIKNYLNQGVQVVMRPSSALKFVVNNKSYEFARAAFGGRMPNQISSDVLSVIDAGGNIYDACDPIINNITNSICLIQNGNCEPSYKAYQAQINGAVAVVIGMNTPGLPMVFQAGNYGHLVTIPVICINQNDYFEIRNRLPNSGSLFNNTPQLVDASFDGGIIAHEYAHGLSIRLTGGPNNNSCLNNAEQGGEGWSDFFALMSTLKLGDFAYANRGIGVWPSGQNLYSNGIRPTPYNVDMNINPAHYGMMADKIKISQPHGIGYLWCSMLWDLNWALIKLYGLEPDIYNSNSNSGNIKALQLVISGLKLQKCSPGFVDARNAILKADTILYNGINACLLWNVFARRGLGWSANQGSSLSREDGRESYDLPSTCSLMTDYELFGNQLLAINDVELDAFRNDLNQVLISWKIQSDKDISKIEVLRTSNNKTIRIALVHGGISQYIDTNPPYERLIYQIKVFANDLEFKESNKVIIPFSSLDQWTSLPNPTNDIIYLENKSIQISKLIIQIVDAQGKHISNSELLYKPKDRIRLDFTDLMNGIYFIFIKNDEGVEKLKIIKQ